MSHSKVYSNALEAIGNTPIVKLNSIGKDCGANLYVKLEFMNPGGSVKDRIGAYLIEDFENKGELKPGGTIVEATSGNTGIGLAMAAAIKGYKCIFVMPDKMSGEKITFLRSFGAEVVITPTGVEPDHEHSHYSVARRLAKETPNAVLINQYDNLSNREAHYKKTGPEILAQMPEIDAMVAGMGTGGTITGTGRYLKEKKPSVKLVCADPYGSIIHDMFYHEKIVTPPGPYKVEGIGEDIIPKNFDLKLLDAVVQIEDKESFPMARELLHKEGLFVGTSSGAAVAATLKWVKNSNGALNGKNILIILPDSADRYMSKIWNDEWMKNAGYLSDKNPGLIPVKVIANAKPLI